MRAVPLIIAPTHSKETRLLASAAVHLHRWFLSRGEKSHILLGFGARKIPLLAMLNGLRGHRIAVFYYGHGTTSTLIGSEFLVRKRPHFHLITENEMALINRRIIEHLRDSLIYTVACDSAGELGVFLVDRGIRSFVGSTQPMWIVQNLDFDKNDIPDMTDLLTLGPRRLAEGETLAQAVEDYKNRAFEMRTNYTLETSYPEMADIIDPNIDYYTIIGDKGWTFDG